jgi:cardiolipin synthase
MIAAITTAFYVFGIIAAIEAIMTVRTAQGAIAWSVSLVTFPFVALPAYLVLGRSKFEGMVEAYEASSDEIDSIVADMRRNLEPWNIATSSRPSMYQAVRKLSGMSLTRGNRVDLLVNGTATFDSILAGIARARDYVLFQFYMIHDDGLGRRVQQALIERANAGVRVYVLYDEIGSKGLPDRYVAELRAAGAQVSAFNATQGVRNRFQLNFRNHRKMVVVDGSTGWVGGHNVGDEYLGLDPEFTPWRDTHVRLEPAVTQLQSVIAHDWYWATREILELDWTPRAAAELGRARHDRAVRPDDAARNRRPRLRRRARAGTAAHLDFRAVLRAGRGGTEGAATCGAAWRRLARDHDRDGRQPARVPGGLSLHADAALYRHPLLCVRPRLSAREGPADRR